MENTTKICTKCKGEKTLDQFPKKSRSRDGLDWNCKACKAIERQIFREKYPEKFIKYPLPNRKTELGKICTKCGRDKSYNEFYLHNGMADGYRPSCKECDSLTGKEYRQENQEKVKQQRLAYYSANRETIREKVKLYCKLHSKEIVVRVKKWQLANPEKVKLHRKTTKQNRKEQIRVYNALPHVQEKVRIRSRLYRLNNPEKRKMTLFKYVATHPDLIKEKRRKESIKYKDKNHERYLKEKTINPNKIKARALRYYYANKDKFTTHRHNRKLRILGNGGKHTNQEWVALKEKYGFTCLKCGKGEPEIKLTVDHVFPIKWGGTNDISNIQPLCRPCNCGKNKRYQDYRPDSPNYGIGWKRPSLWG